MADEFTGGRGAAAGSQRKSREQEERGRMQSAEVVSDPPSRLDSTLQHIVQQLDILTQVS